MQTGTITLPIPEPWGSWLRDLRTGGHTKDEALEVASEMEVRLTELAETSPLPPEPDMNVVNAWRRTCPESRIASLVHHLRR
jgi:uncharacterized protein